MWLQLRRSRDICSTEGVNDYIPEGVPKLHLVGYTEATFRGGILRLDPGGYSEVTSRKVYWGYIQKGILRLYPGGYNKAISLWVNFGYIL